MTHFTWNIETPNVGGKCPCGGETSLICAPDVWEVHSEEPGYDEEPERLTGAEVTAHVCRDCGRMCSFSVNTYEREELSPQPDKASQP